MKINRWAAALSLCHVIALSLLGSVLPVNHSRATVSLQFSACNTQLHTQPHTLIQPAAGTVAACCSRATMAAEMAAAGRDAPPGAGTQVNINPGTFQLIAA